MIHFFGLFRPRVYLYPGVRSVQSPTLALSRLPTRHSLPGVTLTPAGRFKARYSLAGIDVAELGVHRTAAKASRARAAFRTLFLAGVSHRAAVERLIAERIVPPSTLPRWVRKVGSRYAGRARIGGTTLTTGAGFVDPWSCHAEMRAAVAWALANLPRADRPEGSSSRYPGVRRVKQAWQARWWWRARNIHINLGTFTDSQHGSRSAAERAAGRVWEQFDAAVADGSSPLTALHRLKSVIPCRRTLGVSV